jgi:hypothetical protein
LDAWLPLLLADFEQVSIDQSLEVEATFDLHQTCVYTIIPFIREFFKTHVPRLKTSNTLKSTLASAGSSFDHLSSAVQINSLSNSAIEKEFMVRVVLHFWHVGVLGDPTTYSVNA